MTSLACNWGLHVFEAEHDKRNISLGWQGLMRSLAQTLDNNILPLEIKQASRAHRLHVITYSLHVHYSCNWTFIQ